MGGLTKSKLLARREVMTMTHVDNLNGGLPLDNVCDVHVLGHVIKVFAQFSAF